MRSLGTIAVVMSILAAASVSAQNFITLTVGSGGQYAHIADAVAVAKGDDDLGNYYIINLAPGTYLTDSPPYSDR